MACYTVGDLLREARERRQLSQEEVCYGICTSSTLSRIENGEQMPGKKILEGLMQRLGISDWIYDISFCRREGERHELEQELVRCCGKHEYVRAQKLADQLEEQLKKEPDRTCGLKLEQQYLAFVRVILQKNQGQDPQQVLEQLLAVIRMTIPEFDGIHIQTRLLTLHEISILNNIGCAYHDTGNLWDALRLLFDLKEYMEKHTSKGQELAAKYPMILQNLSSWLGQEGYYKDALKLCQKGIDFCIEYGKMHTFPMLLCNKACTLAELGQMRLSELTFIQSFTVFQAVGQREHAEQVRQYAKNYGILVS